MKMLKLLFIIVFISIMLPGAAKATSISTGLYTWYNWWQPSWVQARDMLVISKKVTINPEFLYGPVISINLPKNFVLSTLFVYGDYKISTKEVTVVYSQIFPENNNYMIKRYDSDSIIGYCFADFFKIFLGFKYSYYKYKEDLFIESSNFISYSKTTKFINAYAPGIGLTISVPIKGFFHLIASSSVIYSFGNYISKSKILLWPAFPVPVDFISTLKPHRIGSNSSLSFLFKLSKINASINIGFRYQMFKAMPFTINFNDDDEFKYYDHFYGITIAVIYHFKIKKKQSVDEN